MASPITWEEMVTCYDSTSFTSGDDGILAVKSENIRQTILKIEQHESVADDANYYAADQITDVAIGDNIPVKIYAPRPSLGILSPTFDLLLHSPGAFIKEPPRFYLIEGRLRETNTSDERLLKYREIVSFIEVLCDAATFVDKVSQHIYFFKGTRIDIPVRFSTTEVDKCDVSQIRELKKHVNDTLHRTQKLDILADAVVALVSSQPESIRFTHLLNNAGELTKAFDDGYRLFVSSFSYDKIRTDIENACLEFFTKIHKTFVDIQGQLLGIPIATIVVASQMKPTANCGIDLWTNTAVLFGSWIFSSFLLASVINQLLTLSAIKEEVSRQRRRLDNDFSAIRAKFSGIFDKVSRRLLWYRFLFIFIAALGIAGAVFTTFVYSWLTGRMATTCI